MLKRVIFVVLAALAALGAHAAAVNITSWRFDPTRTGQNTGETILTPANVNKTTFGKLYSYGVDGYVYAQPLYITGLTVNGAVHNVVFVATQHDSVFAFDADQNLLLWQASLLDTAHGAAVGATTVPSTDLGTNDIVPEVGITGTPVIDPTAKTLYVVSKTKENGIYVHRLHALDITTGNEKSGSPVVITASVAGLGTGSVGGTITFDPEWELNRTGLLLYNGYVYISYAAHGDNGPYHGWILSYNATTLQQTASFNSSPQAKGNGIWHSGAAPAADTWQGESRLFFATGNFFNTSQGGPNPTLPYTSTEDYSNAIVRMNLNGGTLTVADEWTPFDQQTLSSADTDQTSGGVLLLPDQGGAVIHELIQVGKNGRIEVLNRDSLGGYNTTYNDIVQEISGQIRGLWSTPAYWNGHVYFWGNNDYLKQFSLTNGQLSLTPVVTSSVNSFFPGVSPVVSSNGTANGILWAVRSDAYNTSGPSVLYAFDATNVATQFYNSTQNAARDAAGTAVKFVVPVVTNGKVYVGTQGQVDVYGLLAQSTPIAPTPTLSPTPATYAAAQTVTLADSLGGASIYYTTNGSVPSNKSTLYTAPFSVGVTTTVEAIATATGYETSGVESGIYTIGSAPTINFSSGFANVNGLTLNGTAVNTDDSRLQLTTGTTTQAGSAFSSAAVNIQSFVTDFTFQLSGSPPIADGITFTIQGIGPTALGPNGGGLGYGPDHVSGTPGIGRSVAIKFDDYNNAGEGYNSTGIYTDGASPTVPAVNLNGTGVTLSSGDTLSVHIVYNGTTLFLTISDPVTGGVYTGSFVINIPSTIGANTAYVGFTGGTGSDVSSQKILTWTFTSQPQSAPIQYATASLPAVSSGPTFRQVTWTGFPNGTGTILDSTAAGQSVTFTVSVPAAGNYDVHVNSKDFNLRGIFQLSVDGANLGTTHDEWSAVAVLTDFDIGTVALSAGNHQFKFTVTGRDGHSDGFDMCFDMLSLYAQ